MNVKFLRENKGFSISELSRKSGVSRSYICELEAKVYKNPNLKVICGLCKGLQCTPNDLIPKEYYTGDGYGFKNINSKRGSANLKRR